MTERNIVYESPKNIKNLARQTLEGRWREALVVMLFTVFLTDLPSLVLGLFDYGSFWVYMLDAYAIFIKAPIQLGLAMYFLKVFRGEPGGTRDIKNAFYCFPNALSLYLSVWLRTTLGFFFFIVPGVMAMFKYSQSFFVLAENPEKHYRQCMYESQMMMQGNKMGLFRLMLSMLPLLIVFKLPSTIVDYLSNPGNLEVYQIALSTGNQSYLSNLTYNNTYLVYVISLISIFYSVYLWNAQACFYDLMTGNLVVTDNEQI